MQKAFFAALGAMGLLAGIAISGTPSTAADHLEAPLVQQDGRTDINDIYAFQSPTDADYTVLIMTVNPLAGVLSPTTFDPEAKYVFQIDNDGNAKHDEKIQVRFGKVKADGSQPVKIGGAAGKANGSTGEVIDLDDGGRAYVGTFDDPFFFDLSGFLGTVEGQGEDMLGQDPTDFFSDLNTLGIVIELPDDALNDGEAIGVWATTSRKEGRSWTQIDRLGRPAINTVVNSSGPIVGAPSEAKNVFNAGKPVDDGDFRQAVIDALQAYSALDAEGSYADEQAGALADVLLPDILTFDKAGSLPPPLNGRGLADDVIDTELRIVTGGDPLDLFDDRDADGGVNSDGVGPHDDYLSEFPYLGEPHS